MISAANKLILAIETSFDETGVAVVKGTEIWSNALYSQVELHKQYGGGVPHIAKLAHQQKFDSVLNEAVEASGVALEDLEAIAVTFGPGLAIALEVGILKAKELSKRLNVPLIAVNHMEGHLLSPLTVKRNDVSVVPQFPILALLASGGHSELVLVEDIGKYTKIGQTVDDAAGEAFDKAAMMLGLEYPGGPAISRLAAENVDLDIEWERRHRTLFAQGFRDGAKLYEIPVPMAFSDDLNMSYSGLKTAIKQLINNLSGNEVGLSARETGSLSKLTPQQVEDVAKMFETVATHILFLKVQNALKQHPEVKELWLGGGVVANKKLREDLRELAHASDIRLRVPFESKLIADNAAMIGVVASFQLAQDRNVFNPDQLNKIDRNPELSL